MRLALCALLFGACSVADDFSAFQFPDGGAATDAAGTRCSTFKQCLGGACGPDGTCVIGGGPGGLYARCAAPGPSTSCASGLCAAGPDSLVECYAACTSDNDCPNGGKCVAIGSGLRSCFN